MHNKHVFIVGTAIEPYMKDKYSVYDSQTRYQQTLETLESIRNKSPQSYICIVETSFSPIPDDYRQKFNTESDLYIELWDDSKIKWYYDICKLKPRSSVYIKSLLETYGLIKIIEYIATKNKFTDARRIFKLTGRYLLNDKFNIDDYHSNFLDHYVIGKIYVYSDKLKDRLDKTPESYLYKHTGMIETGLWSFGRYCFNTTVQALLQSLHYMEEMISFTTGTDIEHSLFHFLDKDQVINIPELGVTIRKGFEGEIINK